MDTKIRYVDFPEHHRQVYEALKGNPSLRSGVGKAMFRMIMAATSPALLAKGSSGSRSPGSWSTLNRISRYEPLEYQVPHMEAPPGDSLHSFLENLPRYELSPKYEEVVRIVAENAELGRKTLVWTTLVRSITTLERHLEPFGPAVVHGGTSDREDQIRRFREDDRCQVLISNPATLGEGISLHQVYHDAVYVGRDFLSDRFLQSLDRIHLLGLTPGTATRLIVLAARGNISELPFGSEFDSFTVCYGGLAWARHWASLLAWRGAIWCRQDP